MAVAVILKSKSIKMVDAPFVASFSSRGPQLITPNILKVFSLYISFYTASG